MTRQLHNACCLKVTSVEVDADLCPSPIPATKKTTERPANPGSGVIPGHRLLSVLTPMPLLCLGSAGKKTIQYP